MNKNIKQFAFFIKKIVLYNKKVAHIIILLLVNIILMNIY